MNQKKKNGMWLRQTKSEDIEKKAWILAIVVVLSASTILILTAGKLIGFSELYSPWVMVAVSGCICIAYGILTAYRKKNLFFPGVLLWNLLLVVVGGKKILNGFCMVWNQMGDMWTAGSGQILPELEVIADGSTENMSLLLFSVFSGSLAAFVCCTIETLERSVFAIIIPVLLFAGMILFHKDETFGCMIPCLIFSVCLLVCPGKRSERGSLLATGSKWALIIVSSIGMFCLLSLFDVDSFVTRISHQVHEKLHETRYETTYTTLPEGKISNASESTDKKQTALVVTMEQPQELYLRGFTGAVFENDTWRPLDTSILAENEDLLYWMNSNGYNIHTQFSQPALQVLKEDSEEMLKQTVTVQNVNACSRYLYVPYTLCQGEYLKDENLSTDGVLSDGTRTYLYSVCLGGTEVIPEITEALQNTDSEEVKGYRETEPIYRRFVYDHYLEVPKEEEAYLAPYWEEAAKAAGIPGELTREQAQISVRKFLEEYFTEENTFQHATVTTLTLRHFGIPARYVEGYIITEEMAENAKDASIKVNESCGGAWVEVYQDGLGWIPMDVTPGIEEQMQNANGDNADGDSPKEKPIKGKELEEIEDEKETDEKPQGGYVVSIPKMISGTVLLVVPGLFLLVMILVLRRYLILKRRWKRWDVESVNDGIGWIFADTVKLLERLGFSRGNGSMWNLLEPVKQRFGEDYTAAFDQMVKINAHAMFCSDVLDETDREIAKTFYEMTLKHLKENEKWFEKLWMQWMLCLY